MNTYPMTTRTETSASIGIGRRRRSAVISTTTITTGADDTNTLQVMKTQPQPQQQLQQQLRLLEQQHVQCRTPTSPSLSKAELSRASTAKINNLHTGPIDLDDEISLSSDDDDDDDENDDDENENKIGSNRTTPTTRRQQKQQQKQQRHCQRQRHRQPCTNKPQHELKLKAVDEKYVSTSTLDQQHHHQQQQPTPTTTTTRLHLDNITNKGSTITKSAANDTDIVIMLGATDNIKDKDKEKDKDTTKSTSLFKKVKQNIKQTLGGSGGSKDEGDIEEHFDDSHTIATNGAIVSEQEIQDLEPKPLKLTTSNLYGHDATITTIANGTHLRHGHTKKKTHLSPTKKKTAQYDRNGNIKHIHSTQKCPTIMMDRWKYENQNQHQHQHQNQHQHLNQHQNQTIGNIKRHNSTQHQQQQQPQVLVVHDTDTDITPLRYNTTMGRTSRSNNLQPIPLRHSLKDGATPSNVFHPVTVGDNNSNVVQQQQQQRRRNSEQQQGSNNAAALQNRRTNARKRQPLSKSVPSNSNFGIMSKPESNDSGMISMIPLESLSMKERSFEVVVGDETALRTCLSEPLHHHRQHTHVSSFEECSSASDSDEFNIAGTSLSNDWVTFQSDPMFLQTMDVQSTSGNGTEITMLPVVSDVNNNNNNNRSSSSNTKCDI